MAELDPKAKQINLKPKPIVARTTAKQKSTGKKFAIEFYVREYSGTQPPEHPHSEDFVAGVDAGFFATNREVAWGMMLKLLGVHLDKRFGGDYSAYPALDQAIRANKSGIITPGAQPISEGEKKIITDIRRNK